MARQLQVSPAKLDAIAQSQTVEDVLFDIAQVGARGTAQRAPVLTGALRDSYLAQSEPGRAWWGSDLDYSINVELGTYKMAPQPHVRPAIDDCRALGDQHV